MGRGLLLTIALVLSVPAFAASGGGGSWYREANNDLGNVASLQRGARYFMNYCAGCHSARYVRYNRLARDLGLDDDLLLNNLMFTGGKPHDTIVPAMPENEASGWFGVVPPDLSLIARARGADHLFNYLTTFYVDESQSNGYNNLVLPGASMPHVMWDLQGLQKAVFHERTDDAGKVVGEEFEKFEQISPGLLSAEEYDQVVRDLVNFMDYMGEPGQLQRRSLGIPVVAFLLLMFLLTYLLKKEFWKQVH